MKHTLPLLLAAAALGTATTAMANTVNITFNGWVVVGGFPPAVNSGDPVTGTLTYDPNTPPTMPDSGYWDLPAATLDVMFGSVNATATYLMARTGTGESLEFEGVGLFLGNGAILRFRIDDIGNSGAFDFNHLPTTFSSLDQYTTFGTVVLSDFEGMPIVVGTDTALGATIHFVQIPEPATWGLIAAGMLYVLLRKYRRDSKTARGCNVSLGGVGQRFGSTA